MLVIRAPTGLAAGFIRPVPTVPADCCAQNRRAPKKVQLGALGEACGAVDHGTVGCNPPALLHPSGMMSRGRGHPVTIEAAPKAARIYRTNRKSAPAAGPIVVAPQIRAVARAASGPGLSL